MTARPPLPPCPSCSATRWRIAFAPPSEGWWWVNSRGAGCHGLPEGPEASELSAARTACAKCRAVPPEEVAEAVCACTAWRVRALVARLSYAGTTGRDPGPRWVPPDDAFA